MSEGLAIFILVQFWFLAVMPMFMASVGESYKDTVCAGLVLTGLLAAVAGILTAVVWAGITLLS